MILVDTSIWIDHFRLSNPVLADLLENTEVLIHPFVIGELALGTLANRGQVLAALRDLPRTDVATEQEVLHFIDRQALSGSGIGYVDAHLLAAARLMPGALLWTRDRRLQAAAATLSLAAIL